MVAESRGSCPITVSPAISPRPRDAPPLHRRGGLPSGRVLSYYYGHKEEIEDSFRGEDEAEILAEHKRLGGASTYRPEEERLE